MKKVSAFLLWVCLFVSCTQVIPTSVSISPTAISFESNGGEESFTVSCNKTWMVSSSSQWCKVSPISGNGGDNQITVEVGPNDDYDERVCEITVMSEDVKKILTITQKAKKSITIDKELFNVSSESQTIEISVTGNVEYNVTIDSDWISQSETKGLTTAKLVFLIAENTSYDHRSGRISITSTDGSFNYSAIVNQATNYGVVIKTTEYNISKDAQQLEIEVQSNTNFNVVPEVDWIWHLETKSLSSSTVVLDVGANDTYEKRCGVVKFTAEQNEVAVTINQEPNYGLEVSPSSVVITSEEQSFDVIVKGNIDYDVIIPNDAQNWVSVVQTKALSESNITFHAKPNQTGDIREALISLKHKNGTLGCSISIVQTAEDAQSMTDEYGQTYLLYNNMIFYFLSMEDLTLVLTDINGICPEELVIPKYVSYKKKILSVEIVRGDVFKNRSTLKKVTIPSSVKEVDASFDGCTSFREMVIEDGDTEIRLSKYMFDNSSVNVLYLGRNVALDTYYTSAYKYATSPFTGKNMLTSLTCSEHVTYIHGGFFMPCSNLTSLVLSDSIFKIGDYGLYGCGAKDIRLPSKLQYVGKYFLGYSSVEKVILPESLKDLPGFSFSSCEKLKEIHIYGLEKMSSDAFLDCNSIRVIYCYMNTPPTIYEQNGWPVFSSSVCTEATLYVPKGTLEAYKNSDGWKTIWNIVEMQ